MELELASSEVRLYNRALTAACEALVRAESEEQLQTIPTGYGEKSFPDWFCFMHKWRQDHPAYLAVPATRKCINDCYKPLLTTLDEILLWEPAHRKLFEFPKYRESLEWLSKQDRYAICCAALSADLEVMVSTEKVVAGLFVCSNLHNTVGSETGKGMSELRMKLEWFLVNTQGPRNIAYPHFVSRIVHKKLAFWDSSDPSKVL